MTTADTALDSSSTSGTAPGAELTIPKHRFDEVNAEVRRLREENDIKNRLIMEGQQQRLQPQQSGPVLPSAEEVGLDPQTYQAVMKLADRIADQKVSSKGALFEQQIGILASRTEKAELLATKGSDKKKYLDEINQMQQNHFRSTGSFMPAEVCLDLIQSKEKDRRIQELEARLAGNPAPAQTQSTTTPSQVSGPSAAATRQIPGGSVGGGGVTQKNFSELSVDEMEARLQEQFSGGQIL